MPALRRTLVRFTYLSAFTLGACERGTPAIKSNAAARQPDSVATAQRMPSNGYIWNQAAGPVLLVQGETGEEAIVLLANDRDSTSAFAAMMAPSARASLFGRGGARTSAQFSERPQGAEAECRIWPLHDVRADGAASIWSVGFLSNEVAPIALDSIDLLASRDSMALAAEASRLASMVTAVTSASFDGLRFTAHDVRRFESAPGIQAVVAHLVRRVNQEANPQEEQTLIIAERDSGVTTGPYKLVYADRAHGLEEQVAAPEVIAAVRIAGRTTLVVARDNETGVAYALLERINAQLWRVRWVSTPTRCG